MIFNEDPLGRMHSDLVLWISGAKARERMGGREKARRRKRCGQLVFQMRAIF